MVKIPIEIIELILDWVDVQSAQRFACAVSTRALDRYLEARYRHSFNESMAEIEKIDYEIIGEKHCDGFMKIRSIRKNNSRYGCVKYNQFIEFDKKYNGYEIINGLSVVNCKLNFSKMYLDDIFSCVSKIQIKSGPEVGETYDYSNTIMIHLFLRKDLVRCSLCNTNYGVGIDYDYKGPDCSEGEYKFEFSS